MNDIVLYAGILAAWNGSVGFIFAMGILFWLEIEIERYKGSAQSKVRLGFAKIMAAISTFGLLWLYFAGAWAWRRFLSEPIHARRRA